MSLAIAAEHTPEKAVAQSTARITFPDNRLLIGLCGEFDRNLSQIEAALEVQITRRGNELAVSGIDKAVEHGAHALQTLYSRLEEDKSVDPADIDAVIRFEVDEDMPTPAPKDGADQLEMFKGPKTEIRTRKKTVEARTKTQATYINQLFSKELVFGLGPAGTGKTYIAVAVAVSMYLDGHVDKIILSRPAVEAGERLGFLPGDMKDKVDPYMQPLYDALNDFLPAKQLNKLMEEKQIEIAPLAFMRGRTLANAFVVLDEAQNATTMQMKMFLTRMGERSRMAITGDTTQIDLPRGVPSGLIEAARVLSDVNEIGFTRFKSEDIVRHPMVKRIIEAYDRKREKHPDERASTSDPL